jgi:hypothetical protein
VYVPPTRHLRRNRLTVSDLPSALVLAVAATFLAGCVSIGPECVSEQVETDELSAHVQFLAQPALKGRKPKTRGSTLARRYIGSRFESYGLAPWGQAKRFAQPFALGTNMIGVLPGADPNLAQEFVIVSAHYDHLGKTDKGTCLGASDNASGVATLLEIAERLALEPNRPRRSICFAAFDCEETFSLGAFAFTCRQDYDESRIAGVVNIDMLGRKGYGLLDQNLFVTGTESFPDLRTQMKSQVPDDLMLLPIGTDIVGVRGDHIAFETLKGPVLFFCCGLHNDYHRPSDTAEKLDYDVMQASAELITETIRTTADSDRRYAPTLSDDGDVEELQAFKSCLDRIRAGYETMGWSEAQARQLDPVIERVDRLLGEPGYTRQDRFALLRTSAADLMPLAIWPDVHSDPNDPNQPAKIELTDSMVILQTFTSEHRPLFIRMARSLIKDLLSRRTSFLLGRTIDTTHIVTEAPDHLIFIEAVEPPQHKVTFLFLASSLGAHIKGHNIGITAGCSLTPGEFTGTKEELTDYSLLLCHNSFRNSWLNVLRRVTGAPADTTYDQGLQARLVEGNWDSEEAWILACSRSGNPRLRYMALASLSKVMDSRAEPILLDVLTDPNATTTDRQAVVASLKADSSAEMLIAVADILSDSTEIKRPQQEYYERLTRPDTPLEGYPLLPLAVKFLQEWLETNAQEPWTMADLAQERLGVVTRRHFDKDAAAARQWIEVNWPPKPH